MFSKQKGKGRIIFYEEGGLKILWGDEGTFFPNLKGGGCQVFLQILTDILSKSEFLFID